MPITTGTISPLVGPVVETHGYDLEDITVKGSGERTEVTIIVDRDGGLDLDDIAALTREISDALDADASIPDTAYFLEVTSRGVDRPLTAPRHWRRAQGRKVRVDHTPADAESDKPQRLVGRIGRLDDDAVDIVVNDRGRQRVHSIPLGTVATAVVEVDFSRPSASELALCGLDEAQIERRRTESAK